MLYTACLTLLLGSPDFRTREAADRELHRLVHGWPHRYGPGVERHRPRSPEARFRLARVVARYRYRLAMEYVPRTTPVWPCCDMLPVPTWGGDVRDGAAIPYYDGPECDTPPVARCGPCWNRWRAGTEQHVRRMIRDGASYAETDALLARMWALELRSGESMPAAATWTTWDGGYPHP